jgi:hypothetical protein
MSKRNYLSILLLSLSCLSLHGQSKKIISQQIYWLRYYNQYAINDKATLQNEIEDRRFFKNSRQHQLVFHTRLHYRFFKNTETAIGLTYLLQSPNDPLSTSKLVVPELRPVQEFSFFNPISNRLSFQHRVRIEERFTRNNDTKTLSKGYDFNFRFRFRIQAQLKLSKEEAKRLVTLKVANEIMFNAGNKIVYNQFDQNRISVALETGLTKTLSLELSYIHWYQQRSSGNQFYSREIARLSVIHKLKRAHKPKVVEE